MKMVLNGTYFDGAEKCHGKVDGPGRHYESALCSRELSTH